MVLRRWLTLALAWIGLAATGQAHDLGCEVRLVSDWLEVRAFFDDGSPAAKARVALFRRDSRDMLSEARTDSGGRCRLRRPEAGEYLVRVDAGAGHIHVETIVVPPRPAGSLPAAHDGTIPDVTAGESSTGTLISTGPTYSEKTRFRWLKLALGLAAIFGLAVVVRWTLRSSSARSPSSSS